jgi:hypothetical protein
LEAAKRDAPQKLVTVAEMAIGRCWTHSRPARRLGERKAGRALLRNQFERGAQQRFLEIPVVIAARAFPVFFDQLM